MVACGCRVGGGIEPAQVRVWRRPKNSSNIAIPNAGHLVSNAHHLSDHISVASIVLTSIMILFLFSRYPKRRLTSLVS